MTFVKAVDRVYHFEADDCSIEFKPIRTYDLSKVFDNKFFVP